VASSRKESEPVSAHSQKLTYRSCNPRADRQTGHARSTSGRPVWRSVLALVDDLPVRF
jgi:hypothetical protein